MVQKYYPHVGFVDSSRRIHYKIYYGDDIVARKDNPSWDPNDPNSNQFIEETITDIPEPPNPCLVNNYIHLYKIIDDTTGDYFFYTRCNDYNSLVDDFLKEFAKYWIFYNTADQAIEVKIEDDSPFCGYPFMINSQNETYSNSSWIYPSGPHNPLVTTTIGTLSA